MAKLKRGPDYVFCSPSCARAFRKGRTAEDCDSLLSHFYHIANVDGRVSKKLLGGKDPSTGDEYLYSPGPPYRPKLLGEFFSYQPGWSRTRVCVAWSPKDGTPSHWADYFLTVKMRRERCAESYNYA